MRRVLNKIKNQKIAIAFLFFFFILSQGNTIAVIEHNLDVIKTADWVIDLGPEGGSEGGSIVAKGTPEDVAKIKESYTGMYLKEVLK